MEELSPAVERGFVPIHGARLYYEIAGTGDPVILVHAGIADCRMWDDQFMWLAQTYRVLRYDRRGYGQSLLPPGDFSHRQDLAALMTHFGISAAHAIGSSYGGSTLLDLAREQPALLRSLIVVGSAPFGFEFASEPPPQAEALDAAIEAGDLDLAAELEVQIWLDGLSRTPGQVDMAMRQKVWLMNRVALQNETQNLGQDQPLPDTARHLGTFNLPALIIWGDLDRPRTQAAGAYLAAHLPGAVRYVMPGCAHLPNMEQPEHFNQVIGRFLAAR